MWCLPSWGHFSGLFSYVFLHFARYTAEGCLCGSESAQRIQIELFHVLCQGAPSHQCLQYIRQDVKLMRLILLILKVARDCW